MFVKDSKLIAKRYFSTWFAIDLVSSIPLTLITVAIENPEVVVAVTLAGSGGGNSSSSGGGGSGNSSSSISGGDGGSGGSVAASSKSFSSINRILRMFKLSKLFRLLKMFRSLRFISDIANFNPGMARLIAGLACLVLVCHWTACFWCAQADAQADIHTDRTLVRRVMCTRSTRVVPRLLTPRALL